METEIKMKIRPKYIDIKNDFEELLSWVRKGSDEDVNLFQEIILNVLRIIINKSFRRDIQILRNNFHVPSSWYKEKKFKPLHMAIWQNSKLNKIQEELANSYSIEENKWFKDCPEASKNIALWNDKTIVELAVKYKLHPRRYGDFLIEYLYFGYLIPSIFTTFEEFTEDESRYKARFELEPENPPNSGIVGYIRFFQDTSINQLQKFIKSHAEQIKSIQKNLDKYPIQEKNRSDSFKTHLEIYLMYCIGYTDTNIYKVSPTRDTPNIRRIISIMKMRIKISTDTFYHKPTSTVKIS